MIQNQYHDLEYSYMNYNNYDLMEYELATSYQYIILMLDVLLKILLNKFYIYKDF